MSYNDNDNDSYGSSNRQGGSGGYGNDRVGDRDTGLGGSSGGFGNDSDSYGSGGARTGGIGSDNTYGGSGNDTYGSSGNDNRGFVDKAKDKLSSDRTDRPDDPITGTNYDQSSSGRNTGYGDNSSSGFGGNTSSGYGDNSSSSYGNDNRGVMDKAKDKLSSDRSDRPDDPISGTNYDQGSSGRNTGYGDNSSSGYGDNSSSSYGGVGNDNRGFADKAKDKLSSDRTDRPDDPITGTNYDQSNTGRSGGLGGDSYGSSDRTGAGGYGDNTSSNFGDNSSSNYGGVGQDNRSFTEKAKDKLSGNRSDRPDDPISGKNYGEDDSSYGNNNNNNNNNNNKPSLMDKVKDKVGLNKDKNDNSYGGSDNYGSSGRNDNY